MAYLGGGLVALLWLEGFWWLVVLPRTRTRHLFCISLALWKLQTSFGSDRVPDFHLLEQAEPSAKRQKLKSGKNLLKERRYPTVQQFASLNLNGAPILDGFLKSWLRCGRAERNAIPSDPHGFASLIGVSFPLLQRSYNHPAQD
ncbi:hypothetical protein VNO77_26995 [Canavalia gladiata]|uniref:Uncharacterized protein n=1 Tax=Canavalia gladiata TaxID=3824 RepID=A0AAN9KWE5_CANGL